jgi:hypothetical protein
MQPAAIESNQRVPYGTKLTATLGAPNYLTGDYNGNGEVDAADYVVWRHSLGQAGSETNHPAADANHDFLVDAADYDLWRSHFGAPHNNDPETDGSLAAASTVPEPCGVLIATMAVIVAVAQYNRKPCRFSRGACPAVILLTPQR